MRKLLLATAAVLGGSIGAASLAHAQAPAAPPTIVPTPVPFTLAPGQTPGPGTITVRLNARVNFYAQTGSDSGRNPGSVTTAAGATTAGNTITATNTKLSNYSFQEYARLFPGFDGIAGNGLKYGGAIEIRQDNAVAPGGGINGSVSAGSRSRGTLYFRREYGYLGADQLGILRFGSTDGAASLFTTGTFENFNDGNWNGDLPTLFTGSTQLTWPFPDVGVLYTSSKITYLSPQLYGFDFGTSFAPNTGNVNEGNGNCAYANTAASASGANGPLTQGQSVGCDATASTTTGDYTRYRDLADFELRYRGAFGPIGIATETGYIVSGKVNDSLFAAPGTFKRQQYDGLSLGDAGIQITYGGLAVGGHITAGRSNGQFNLDPKGQRNSIGWLAGTSYAIGPFIVGASYFDYQSAGSKANIGTTGATSPFVAATRNEYGISAGGTYTFAPGMNIFLSYLYGHRKQGGVDLLSGVTSTATANVQTHNNVQSQGISIGTQFRW